MKALLTILALLLTASVLLTAPVAAAMNRGKSPPPLNTEDARLCYSIGYQVGTDFRRQEIPLDPEMVARGAEDAVAGEEPLLSPPEMHKALTDLQRRVPSP